MKKQLNALIRLLISIQPMHLRTKNEVHLKYIIKISLKYLKFDLLKGNALFNLKKYHEAIESYEKALELNPDDNLALNNKGMAHSEIKDYEKAIECFDQSILTNPSYIVAYHKKGRKLVIKIYQKY